MLTMPKPKGKPKAEDDGAKPYRIPSTAVRAPNDIAEMIDTIAQHELQGWRTSAAILDDAECPLREWLLPLYHRVLEEKAKRAAEIKKRTDQ